MTVGPFQENTFFLKRGDSDEVIVIDPGDEAARLIDRIDGDHWKPVAIVNTHAHLDHIGAVQAIKERYDIPFYLHPDDEPLLEAGPEQARMFGLPPSPVPAVDHSLRDGVSLDLAGFTIKVMLAPGHSPGSVVLHVEDHLIAGDVLFQGSIGRTDLPGGDYEVMMNTLRSVILPLPDETHVHPGHGSGTTIGVERRSNPFLIPLSGS